MLDTLNNSVHAAISKTVQDDRCTKQVCTAMCMPIQLDTLNKYVLQFQRLCIVQDIVDAPSKYIMYISIETPKNDRN